MLSSEPARPRECCGVVGVWGVPEAARAACMGLYALQHRGEESAGIVVREGRELIGRTGMGLVSDVFRERDLERLGGEAAIGHVRYSTTGSSQSQNVQPFLASTGKGQIAVGHNGNLVNAVELHRKLVSSGAIFQTSMDTEILVHLFAQSYSRDPIEAIVEALIPLRGAFSFVILLENALIAARDPHGFRPLSLGKLRDAFVVASETSAFDLIGAEYVREVDPGEVLVISSEGTRSLRPFPTTMSAYCIFEYIYFAKPDSRVFGNSVYETRKRLGLSLAEEHPCDADIVSPIPDSGTFAAMGYAERSGVPFEMAVVRNHYIGRTFIQPTSERRQERVRLKLNPVRDVITGKSIVIIEDSIVRGTTSTARVRTLREAGAREVHMRVSCPPHRFPCFYGIDFPSSEELIASTHSVEQIAEFIGLDSLGYLSHERMLEAMPIGGENFCTACFNGKYPVPVDPATGKLSLEEATCRREMISGR
jgi:amidophosphoribosyltransferase